VDTWSGVTVVDNRVTRLGIVNKGMTGPLPAELGNLSSLEFLYLASNQLTGTLPAELGNLSSLQ
jgi:Leucine-rich repeat (LRR) protein